MAENPLLPNAELRALHRLLKELSATANSAPKARPRGRVPGRGGREALLAGTLMQLRAGDLVVPEAEDLAAIEVVLSARGKKQQFFASQIYAERAPRLLLAAGMAAALQRSGSDDLVVAFVRANSSEPQWAEALFWAQEQLLPILFVCADASGAEAFRPAAGRDAATLDWTSFERSAGRVQLPILSVDGQDAVAVYRVMQESVLRARTKGGPAALWAVLPSEQETRKGSPALASSLERLQHYLRTRKISLT